MNRPDERRWLYVVLLVLCTIPLVFPGDAPWISDEPRLVSAALQANREHRLVEHGLPGTIGVVYGPLPGWFYQISLAMTHDPVVLVALRAAVVTLVTAASL